MYARRCQSSLHHQSSLHRQSSLHHYNWIILGTNALAQKQISPIFYDSAGFNRWQHCKSSTLKSAFPFRFHENRFSNSRWPWCPCCLKKFLVCGTCLVWGHDANQFSPFSDLRLIGKEGDIITPSTCEIGDLPDQLLFCLHFSAYWRSDMGPRSESVPVHHDEDGYGTPGRDRQLPTKVSIIATLLVEAIP